MGSRIRVSQDQICRRHGPWCRELLCLHMGFSFGGRLVEVRKNLKNWMTLSSKNSPGSVLCTGHVADVGGERVEFFFYYQHCCCQIRLWIWTWPWKQCRALTSMQRWSWSIKASVCFKWSRSHLSKCPYVFLRNTLKETRKKKNNNLQHFCNLDTIDCTNGDEDTRLSLLRGVMLLFTWKRGSCQPRPLSHFHTAAQSLCTVGFSCSASRPDELFVWSILRLYGWWERLCWRKHHMNYPAPSYSSSFFFFFPPFRRVMEICISTTRLCLGERTWRLHVSKEMINMKDERDFNGKAIIMTLFNYLELEVLTGLPSCKWDSDVAESAVLLMKPWSPDMGQVVITWHPNHGLASLGLLKNQWLFNSFYLFLQQEGWEMAEEMIITVL